MEALRIMLYGQIESLQSELMKEDNANQYGFSPSEINNKIDELETRISETWTR